MDMLSAPLLRPKNGDGLTFRVAMMTSPLDHRALVAPLNRDEIRSYTNFSKSIGVPAYDSVPMTLRSVATTALVLIFTPLFAATGVVGLVTRGVTAETVAMAFFSLILVAGALILLMRVRLPRRGRRLWRERLAVSRFAEENGASYEALTSETPRVGMLFSIGNERRVSDRVRFQRDPRFEVGNLSYRINLPKNAVLDFHWGYIRIPLERRFPHTVLDSRSNNGVRGARLPASMSNRGTTELEGDFSRFFELTVPPGYERDALYLLTPDLMALLIDEGADFDVEIVDDELFVYRPTPFALATTEEWQRIERIVDTIGARAQRRTQRYSDERIGDRLLNRVAPGGRRIAAARLSLPAIALLLAIGAAVIAVIVAPS